TGTTVGLGVLQRVTDHPELFVLANHSWSHPDFRDLSTAQIRDELVRTDAAFVDAIGRSSRPWFRPPFGGVDDRVLRDVGAAGYSRTIMWDIDTIDWRPVADGGPSADDLVATVVSRAQGGSIVLMHLGGFNTLDALPDMVAGLRSKGLTPVTLEDMTGV
ncbi:MAG TPA: polysaccharide deacetylase family protein, partial [Candidatus Limnocylindrales bacterium]